MLIGLVRHERHANQRRRLGELFSGDWKAATKMELSDAKVRERASAFLFGKTGTIAVVCLMLLWLYIPSLTFHFWLDDFGLLESGRIESVSDFFKSFHPVRSGLGPGEILPYYRPLTQKIYYWVMRLTFGLNPFYYRFADLCLLGLIAFNISLITGCLSNDKLAGFLSAILFALGTSHAITQMWMALTEDLIVVVFMTAAFFAYLQSARNGRKWCFAASVILFVLGLLSMEYAIVLPGLIFVAEVLYALPGNKNEVKRLAARLTPFVLIVFAYVGMRLVYMNVPEVGPYEVSVGLFTLTNLGRYLLIGLDSYLIGFLGVPSMDTLVSQHVHYEVNWALAGVKLLIVAAPVAWMVSKQRAQVKRDVVFSFAWFVLALMPVLFLPNHFYRYYLLPANLGLVFFVATILAVGARAIAAHTRAGAFILCIVLIFSMLAYSTKMVRKEQSALRLISLSMESIDRQLLQQISNPPDGSGFVFSGNFSFGWWRNLSPAIRTLYDNPTLNATLRDGDKIPEKVLMSPGPLYLVHIEDGVVTTTRAR
ncbi:MAG: hypothetical protein C4532_13345 [Candidatus Abyssobacteria bacterium SURF_17]|uniref:Glycosyltransferase RgtA/B/C/D-like domain-containing protein n=1 Tax=Candidatus Abyssobacteria bacterium SURF_17 TaxID=2093361 RepID=A0A419EUR7_9BACT|nr:MAG: hypothetical protein C4532_13345 [Candidatus Abyssubacteria bacterium SURF_17]